MLNRRERFVSWFQSGPGANDVRCVGCGAGHGSGGWYRLAWRDLGPLARVRQLPQLWRYLHHVRSWDPTPLFYSYATAAGLVVGGVAAAITRRRGLIVATPLAAFLTTFAIAARPVFSRQGRELVREFVDPAGSDRRYVARRASALRAQHGRVPVLVPATWDGAVRLVGIGLAADAEAALRSVTIAAEPPDGQAPTPRLRLRTQPPDEFDPDVAVIVVANAEHRDVGTPVGPGNADLQVLEMPEPSPDRVAALRAAWRDAALPLDGEHIAARLLVGREAQVAVIELDDHVVEVTGHGVDLEHLQLHRPADLEPLITAYEAAYLEPVADEAGR
ncbi:MAG TPA: hypothetical protein VK906_11425 [Egicoccus sp.]|nr:hypothetical protein [Egicoccus sp.]HSK23782.1 hypothetical protein [Egicoccus sp.]